MADTYMPIHSICVLLSILDESDMDVRTIVGGGMKPKLQHIGRIVQQCLTVSTNFQT